MPISHAASLARGSAKGLLRQVQELGERTAKCIEAGEVVPERLEEVREAYRKVLAAYEALATIYAHEIDTEPARFIEKDLRLKEASHGS